jgi:hypothetical protein
MIIGHVKQKKKRMFCMSISKRNEENRIPVYILSFTAGRDDHAEVYGVATFGLTATELPLAHVNCWAVENQPTDLTDPPDSTFIYNIYCRQIDVMTEVWIVVA